MGVDIKKQIITGAFYSSKDLGAQFVDDYFMKDNEMTFGGKVILIQLNPWGSDSIFQDYIIGVVDQEEEGDGDRAEDEDKELIKEIRLNEESKSLVEEKLSSVNLLNKNDHPIKTYRIHYFT